MNDQCQYMVSPYYWIEEKTARASNVASSGDGIMITICENPLPCHVGCRCAHLAQLCMCTWWWKICKWKIRISPKGIASRILQMLSIWQRHHLCRSWYVYGAHFVHLWRIWIAFQNFFLMIKWWSSKNICRRRGWPCEIFELDQIWRREQLYRSWYVYDIIF